MLRPPSFRPAPREVARRVLLIVALKLVAIVVLYQLFFPRAERPEIVPETVSQHLLGAGGPTSQGAH